MADAHPSLPRPRAWGDAFAALPAETPASDAWTRIAAHLPAPAPARARRPARLRFVALAAALALAAVLPWRLAQHGSDAPRVAAAASTGATAQARPAQGTPATPEAVATAPARTMPRDTGATPLGPRVSSVPSSARVAVRGTPTASGSRTASRTTTPSRTPRIHTPTITPEAAPARATAAAADPLEPLFAESARLEAWVAWLRDERSAGGTTAALASGYETRIASIDASLSQAAMPDGVRQALWRERIAALRGLAGLESAQRVLAAAGYSHDALLVSVD